MGAKRIWCKAAIPGVGDRVRLVTVSYKYREDKIEAKLGGPVFSLRVEGITVAPPLPAMLDLDMGYILGEGARLRYLVNGTSWEINGRENGRHQRNIRDRFLQDATDADLIRRVWVGVRNDGNVHVWNNRTRIGRALNWNSVRAVVDVTGQKGK